MLQYDKRVSFNLFQDKIHLGKTINILKVKLVLSMARVTSRGAANIFSFTHNTNML